MIQLPYTLEQRYQLESVIGYGGFGTVYAATDKRLQRHIAVKLIHPHLIDFENQQRFTREAQLASQLNHPHLLTIHDFQVMPNGVSYLVSEYLQGCSLKDYLKTYSLPLVDLLSLLHQICLGLDVAHKNGVIHRDIKPANLFLEWKHGLHTTVIDFGIAKALSSTKITQTHTTLGTPEYMSPEHIIAEKDLVPASDLYSLGIILFECLHGYTPFEDKDAFSVFMKHIQSPIPKIDLKIDAHHKVKQAVTSLISDLTHKSSKKRIQNAYEVCLRVESILKLLHLDLVQASRLSHLEDQIKAISIKRKALNSQRYQAPSHPDTSELSSSYLQQYQDAPQPDQAIPSPPSLKLTALRQKHFESNLSFHATTNSMTKIDDISSYFPNVLVESLETKVDHQVQHGDAHSANHSEQINQSQSTTDHMNHHLRVKTAPLLEDDISVLDRQTPSEFLSVEELHQKGVTLPKLRSYGYEKQFYFISMIVLVIIASLFWYLIFEAQTTNYQKSKQMTISKYTNATQSPLHKTPQMIHKETDQNIIAIISDMGITREQDGVNVSKKTSPKIPSKNHKKSKSSKQVKPAMMTQKVSNDKNTLSCPSHMILRVTHTFPRNSFTRRVLKGEKAILLARQGFAYCIDQYEYPGYKQIPKTSISFRGAKSLCQIKGKRLCTANEWVLACQHGKRKYPYGHQFKASYCNTEDSRTKEKSVTPSGSFKKCHSRQGVYDLSGNVAEWVLNQKVYGGTYKSDQQESHCTHGVRYHAAATRTHIGFRCCYDFKE